MEDHQDSPTGEGTDLQKTPLANDLTPLNIIRTETVISRLPIHNLAKKGRVNIQIVRKTTKGEIDLKWEVSYSDRYGQPRQLAYKLDTLVINRRIDEEGRPLPKMIRIGSLREIAEDLGLGGDTASVKKALRQNASAFITAKFNYTGNDGNQRNLEADFTRYGVVFTGEKLPDGRTADSVYIILNEPYREVVNNSPVRPLDYDYLKILPPIAQRFYEIVSRKIFAALKHGHQYARLSYSEFCTYSAQQRQPDYNHFKKQMYKVHRPHLKSGYISKIQFQSEPGPDGNEDWMMLYTPGPKAHAEFEVFNGTPRMKRAPRTRRTNMTWRESKPAVSNESREVVPEQQILLSEKTEAPESSIVTPQILDMLIVRGVMRAAGVKLLGSLPPDRLDRVQDYVEYWDEIPADKKTPGLLYALINNADPLPATFQTSRQRDANKIAEERRHRLVMAKQSLEFAYDEYRGTMIDRFVSEQFSKDEFERRVGEKKRELSSQRSLWANRPHLNEEMARHLIRAEVGKQVSLLSFEDFCRQEAPTILAPYAINPDELGIANAAPRAPETSPPSAIDEI